MGSCAGLWEALTRVQTESITVAPREISLIVHWELSGKQCSNLARTEQPETFSPEIHQGLPRGILRPRSLHELILFVEGVVIGGRGRNRTDDAGFAVPCITTLLPGPGQASYRRGATAVNSISVLEARAGPVSAGHLCHCHYHDQNV